LERVQAATKPEVRDPLQKKLDEGQDKLRKSSKDKRFELGWAVLECAADDPRSERFRFLSALLKSSRAAATQPETSYAEIRFLHRLAEFLEELEQRPGDAKKLTASMLLLVLQNARKTEEAAVCKPRVWPWIQPLFEEANKKRQEGMDVLFKQRPDQWDRAMDRLRAAQADFNRAIKARDDLARAYSFQEDALATLPAVLPYLLAAQTTADRTLMRAWDHAVQSLREIDDFLATSKLDDVSVLEGPNRDLERSLEELQAPFSEKQIRQLVETKPAHPLATYLELEARLKSPWMTAPLRAMVWEKARQLARQFHQETLEADTDPESRLVDDEDVPRRTPDSELIGRRADLSLGLLKLTRPANFPDLLAKRKRAAWDDLVKELRAAWGEQLRRLRAAERDLESIDRLNRLLPTRPDDFRGPGENSSAERCRQEQDNYLRWLEAYHRAEGS
jgi:hypothetical protein